MKKKNIIFILILVLTVGYAAVVTTFNIIGRNPISINQEDFDVYFSKAIVDGFNKSDEIIIDDKKTIAFGIHELQKVGDKLVLEYEVVNASTQYDARVSVECAPNTSEYLTITNDVEEIIYAQTKEEGILEVVLNKITVETIETELTCELNIDAVERNSTAVEVCTDSNPSIPVISGGNDTWSSEDVEVVLSESGTAISGVLYYEYYISEVESTPSDTQEASGTTEGNLLVSDNGTNYIYYRTVSNSGCKSGWSNGVKVMIDKTAPSNVLFGTKTATESTVTLAIAYEEPESSIVDVNCYYGESVGLITTEGIYENNMCTYPATAEYGKVCVKNSVGLETCSDEKQLAVYYIKNGVPLIGFSASQTAVTFSQNSGYSNLIVNTTASGRAGIISNTKMDMSKYGYSYVDVSYQAYTTSACDPNISVTISAENWFSGSNDVYCNFFLL